MSAREDTTEFADLAQQVCRASRVPGLSVAVADRTGLRYCQGFGHASLAPASPATCSTAYRWFSMTKLVTATAALRLADLGHLDLDAPVSEHLEDWPARHPVSTRQLLTHTAGLTNPLPVTWVHPAGVDGPDQATMLRGLLGRRRMFRRPPGARAAYSNVGYLAAAQVVAHVARAPYRDHVRDVLLRPLGMTATGFEDPGQDSAVGYLNVPKVLHPLLRALLPDGIVGEQHAGVRSLNPFLVDGDGYGGLVGPVKDAARFVQLHLRDGELDGVRVLAPQTATEMRRIVAPGRPFDHATGWFRDRSHGTATEEYVEHYGTGAGFWNVARLYPQRGLGVVLMSNSSRRFDLEALMSYVVAHPTLA